MEIKILPNPAKPNGRDSRLIILLTASERAQLEALADRRGLTLSAVARGVLRAAGVFTPEGGDHPNPQD